ncbi:NAD(P)-dependent alcohol dehydrogenase [Chitinophaga sancti]|uniref:NAD(P)-dependent alcohol dehydrogenase n=1 Tax=Chitinophaga sancti TaxID=1004 RepID=UPI003F79A1BE
MRKIIYKQFGGTEVLEMVEAAMPAGEIIVKVKAVSVNPLDWKLWQGEMTMMGGKKFPKELGIDFAGVVFKGNAQYKEGDAVFGLATIFKGGAMAEFVGVKAADITLKPESLSFEEAACLPVAGGAAWQIVGEIGKVKAGMEVLVNGSAGGIGPFLVQMAKRKGAMVTAVVGAVGMEMVRELGSDVVLDYRSSDVEKIASRFDLVVDLAGKMRFAGARGMLKAKGVYVNTSPGVLDILGSFVSGRYKVLLLKPTAEKLKALAKSGLKVVIGKRYAWEDFRKGYEEVKRGGIVGKAVFVL